MSDNYIIIKARVVSVDDEYDGMRIKVRLNGLDGTKTDQDLPYCFPLLPKLIHVNPKVGECVLVFLEKTNSPTSNRYFIGPVLSQPYFYEQEMYDISALNMLLDKNTAPLQHPNKDPLNNGTLPNRDDVAIIGRENTDMVLKDSEVRIRCGYKKDPNGLANKRLQYNTIDPAYIQMRYKKIKDNNGNEINSNINIVADRINLLSRDSKDLFNLTDPDNLISDDELIKILDKAHQLPYGDELVEFLQKFIMIFMTHTHPYAMLPPSLTQPERETLNTDLNNMLSKSVRIN